MKKYGSFFAIVLLSLGLSTSGCRPKPAYSDIKVEQPERSTGEATPAENKPADPVAEVDKKAETPEGQNPSQPTTQPTQPAGQLPAVVIPAFLDLTKNQIKDIPKYPKSQLTNIQYGPIGDGVTVFMVLQTVDPVDKVGGFYESELKRNGWTIASNTHDASYFEWNVKKGEANQGTIKIAKEDNGRSTYISLTRSEKKTEKKP